MSAGESSGEPEAAAHQRIEALEARLRERDEALARSREELDETHRAIATAQQQRSTELRELREEYEAIVEATRSARLRLEMEMEVRSTEFEEAVRQLELREGEIWELTDAADRNAARVEASLANLNLIREDLNETKTASAEKDKEIGELNKELEALRSGSVIPAAVRAQLADARRENERLHARLAETLPDDDEAG